MGSDDVFPRELDGLEKKLLLWVLPPDQPGYAEYRDRLTTWKVLGERPWGGGSLLLGPSASNPDVDAPPPHPVAVGIVEGPQGVLTVTVRELQAGQLECDITGPADRELDRSFEQLRRWTLSSWRPDTPCPSCGGPPREVVMTTVSGRMLVLALCTRDQRLWVHDDLKKMNIPLPVTGFYNELMLQLKIHDPGIALQSRRLFLDLETYTDAVLTRAFEAHNRIRNRVHLDESLVLTEERPASLLRRLGKMFG
jgi:hypothetical protein